MSRGAPRRSRVHSRCRGRRRHIPVHSMGSHSRSTGWISRSRARPVHGAADRRLVVGIVPRAHVRRRLRRRAADRCGRQRRIAARAGPLAAIDSAQAITTNPYSARAVARARSMRSGLVVACREMRLPARTSPGTRCAPCTLASRWCAGRGAPSTRQRARCARRPARRDRSPRSAWATRRTRPSSAARCRFQGTAASRARASLRAVVGEMRLLSGPRTTRAVRAGLRTTATAGVAIANTVARGVLDCALRRGVR
jgi:hypothetical protein